MACRYCGTNLVTTFIEEKIQPSANRFLTAAALSQPEPTYPLKTYVCDNCLLVQLDGDRLASEIFTADYAYYSSYSASWVRHAERYVESVIDRFRIGENSFVIEVASNDGYLLQHFVNREVPCLGIDPAEQAAENARSKGVETRVELFGKEVAKKVMQEIGHVDLFIGNNVLAHVPELNDFVSGIEMLLKPDSVVTMEFPHVMKLIENVQFDTIYDEHFSYFSLGVTIEIFAKHGITIFDVEELTTHGGSLRIYGVHSDEIRYKTSPAVSQILEAERKMRLDRQEGYLGLQDKVDEICKRFVEFLAERIESRKSVVAFGAAAKGNTFLNQCCVTSNQIEYVVDDTPAKQGKYLPQSHIPILKEDRLRETKPDYILILPWNFKADICEKLEYARDWGCKFVTCVPRLEIY